MHSLLIASFLSKLFIYTIFILWSIYRHKRWHMSGTRLQNAMRSFFEYWSSREWEFEENQWSFLWVRAKGFFLIHIWSVLKRSIFCHECSHKSYVLISCFKWKRKSKVDIAKFITTRTLSTRIDMFVKNAVDWSFNYLFSRKIFIVY
jgi:hypothetical protein